MADRTKPGPRGLISEFGGVFSPVSGKQGREESPTIVIIMVSLWLLVVVGGLVALFIWDLYRVIIIIISFFKKNNLFNFMIEV